MKKIITLLALCLLTLASVRAEIQTVFSLTVNNQSAAVDYTTGSALDLSTYCTFTSGATVTFSYTSNVTGLISAPYKTSPSYLQLTKNYGITVTLPEGVTLQAGDVITFNEGESVSNNIALGKESRTNQIEVLAASPIYTVKEGDIIYGRNSFYIGGNTSNVAKIRSIKIERLSTPLETEETYSFSTWAPNKKGYVKLTLSGESTKNTSNADVNVITNNFAAVENGSEGYSLNGRIATSGSVSAAKGLTFIS